MSKMCDIFVDEDVIAWNEGEHGRLVWENSHPMEYQVTQFLLDETEKTDLIDYKSK